MFCFREVFQRLRLTSEACHEDALAKMWSEAQAEPPKTHQNALLKLASHRDWSWRRNLNADASEGEENGYIC